MSRADCLRVRGKARESTIGLSLDPTRIGSAGAFLFEHTRATQYNFASTAVARTPSNPTYRVRRCGRSSLLVRFEKLVAGVNQNDHR